jgi:hypothetical protein
LQLLAALPDSAPDASLAPWVERCARSWVEPVGLEEATVSERLAEVVTETAEPEHEVTATRDDPETLGAVSVHHVDSEGRQYTAIPLYDVSSGQRRLAAAFVPEAAPLQGMHLSRPLTLTIARDLIEFGDASGWNHGQVLQPARGRP